MTTATSGKVRVNPPPPPLMRLINPLVRRALASRIVGSRVGNVAILEFTGRRTGRALQVPAGVHQIDGVPTTFTSRAWRLNFAGGTPVTVVQHARPHYGRGVLLDATPEQLGTALRQALDSGASPFALGLKIAGRYRPTIADLGAVNLSMIQFHLEPPTSSSPRSAP